MADHSTDRYADIPDDTRALFESHGYLEYRCHEPHRDAHFQRGFRDDIGKRYSIDLWGYAPLPQFDRPDWRWEVAIHVNSTAETPLMNFEQNNLALATAEELDEAEGRVLAFWTMMGQPYYEKHIPDAREGA